MYRGRGSRCSAPILREIDAFRGRTKPLPEPAEMGAAGLDRRVGERVDGDGRVLVRQADLMAVNLVLAHGKTAGKKH